jgi:glycosyltransferase involved in cell wall biosynthesis
VDIFTSDAYDLEYFWRPDRRRVDKKNERISNINVYRFKIFHYPFAKYLRKILALFPFLLFKCMFSFPSPFVPGLLVKSFITRFNYDIVHATCFPYDSLIYCAFKITKRNHIPLVIAPLIHLGEKDTQNVSSFYTRKNQIEMLKASDAVFVNTICEKEYLQKTGIEKEKVHITPPAITPSQLSGGNKTTFLDRMKIKNNVIVGHLAAKSYDKGTIHLVESMKVLWEKGIDAKLVLAGIEMTDFKKYYSGLSATLKDKMICLGFIDEQTKKDFFAAIDIFALPPRTDSFGIVFLEAWFYRKPVIGADAGGIPYVIKHNYDGYIVPFGDVIELARKIEDLIKDKSLSKRFGDHGYTKTINNFDWDKQTKEILRIYKSLT